MKYLTLLTLLFTFSCSSGDSHEDDTDPLTTASVPEGDKETPPFNAGGETSEGDDPVPVKDPQEGGAGGGEPSSSNGGTTDTGGESLGGSSTGGTSNTGGSNEEGGAGSSSVPPTPPVVDQMGYVFDPADFPEGTPPLLESWTSDPEYEDRYHWVQAKPEHCRLLPESASWVRWDISYSLPTPPEDSYEMYVCPRNFNTSLPLGCIERKFRPEGGAAYFTNYGKPIGPDRTLNNTHAAFFRIVPNAALKNALDIEFYPHNLVCHIMVFDPEDPTKYVKMSGVYYY